MSLNISEKPFNLNQFSRETRDAVHARGKFLPDNDTENPAGNLGGNGSLDDGVPNDEDDSVVSMCNALAAALIVTPLALLHATPTDQ
jgi:hypothetical protein